MRVTAALGLICAACAQHDTDPVAVKAGVTTTAPPAQVTTRVATQAAAARAGGVVVSLNKAGVPQLIRAVANAPAITGATAEKAARAYVGRFAAAYGVSSRALDSLRVVRTHDVGRGGIIVVLRHRVAGIDAYRADIKVLLRRDLKLVAISGAPVAGALPRAGLRPDAFRAQPADALATALTDHFRVPVVASWVTNLRRASHGYYKLDLTRGTPVTLTRSARAKQVMYPVSGNLVPAWLVEFFASDRPSTDADAYQFVIAGDDARVLYKKNLTANDSFTYRVWADPTTLRPDDGPLEDRTPHPASAPDGQVPPVVPSSLVTVEGFNTNPMGQADPWLAPDATFAHGNNADVYSDFEAPDGFSAGDLRAEPTAANTFDYSYDFGAQPLDTATQTKAAVVHAFYVVNWLHDWFYDSGFDEAAGNAQIDNYGRGGEGNDELLIEVQDGYNDGQRNNANMSTPGDGSNPRMQIYVWSAPQDFNLTLSTEVDPLFTNGASFGPSNFDISGNVVLADDGTGTATDGCEAITNNISGAIALIDRGNCAFAVKVENAQDAGAIGVLIANNQMGEPAMFMGGSSDLVTIGVLSLGYDDGQALKLALESGPVTTTMQKTSGVEREGGLDSSLLAHEWGHYFHHRLADCGAKHCGGMSEGWGDFIALYMTIRDGDNLDGSYGSAAYAASGFADVWYGTRRTAYSTDTSIDPLMFRHISDDETLPGNPLFRRNGASNSEVHNTGEVWATMLLDAYVALIRAHLDRGSTFAEARRTMGDYLVGGLMMAPRDATFTEQRDAILAVADANEHADAVALASGFANRGAGSCAESPNRYSQDNVGVVESTETKSRLVIADVRLEADRDCDADGVLDATESAILHVTVVNASLIGVSDTMVTVTSPTGGVALGEGASFTIASLDAYASTTFQVPVELDPFVEPLAVVELKVTAANESACNPSVAASVVQRVNSDDVREASATDTVEASETAWTRWGAEIAGEIWQIDASDPGDRNWQGRDWGSPSDTALESPDLVVSETEPLVVTFNHRYRFEQSSDTNWDGAVIEVSPDAGESWLDVTNWGVNPGYGGQITDQSGNPLAFRDALVGTSPSWPDEDTVTLDFGDVFAGQTIRLRFRIGTDAAVGDDGWFIDDIAVTGIDNTPFTAVTDNGGVCGIAVDAGPDHTVESGGTVVLRARAAASAGATLSFAWTQDSGDAVDLWYPDSAVATFEAPTVSEPRTFTFTVELSDTNETASDSVTIRVVPRASGDGGSGSGGCQTGGDSRGGFALLVLVLGALLVRRRRDARVPQSSGATDA